MSICFYPSRPRPSPFTRRPKLDPFPRQRASSPNRAFSQSVSFPLRPLHRDSAIPLLSLLSSLSPSRFLRHSLPLVLSQTHERTRAVVSIGHANPCSNQLLYLDNVNINLIYYVEKLIIISIIYRVKFIIVVRFSYFYQICMFSR